MNKSELIDAIATKADISKADATKALDALLDTVVETVAAGDAVNLIGFGSFKTSERAARQGQNPKTGEKIDIPAATVPKFTVGAGFKSAVAKK